MNSSPAYQLFDDPLSYYHKVLSDIDRAKKSVYLATYRFHNDNIGMRFRDYLTKKASEGLEIKILMDSWGTNLPTNFFAELVQFGGEVRYFKKIKFFWDFFTQNHRRYHRKLLIIDDQISYIGSANITGYSLNWRELILRVKGALNKSLKKVFLQDWEIYNKYVFEKQTFTRKISLNGFEILRDVPSLTRQRIRKRYVELIKKARKRILIETPYFLPGYIVRKALLDAAARNVDIGVIIPRHSDVGLIDVLRNRYIGLLHKGGIKFYFYTPYNLHAKVLLVDDDYYSVGSPNFDYRSFRYQHEIAIVGKQEEIIDLIVSHIDFTLTTCEDFNFENWENRPRIQKFFEWLLMPIRHLL